MGEEEKIVHRELLDPDAPGPTQMARIWGERRSSGLITVGCEVTVLWANREEALKEVPRNIRKLIGNMERERDEAIADHYERLAASETPDQDRDPLDDKDDDDQERSPLPKPTSPYRRQK